MSEGEPIEPTKGSALEFSGVLLELTNPLARLSRTEARGMAFSCLGELCWYLAGTASVDFIAYYLTVYDDIAEDGLVYGGYGPRLFNWNGTSQVDNVIDRLRSNPATRRAVIPILSTNDVISDQKEIPCTCTLQFLLRENRLHMIVMMRSNDVILGLPHDIFCFTMLQELIARTLNVDLGWYRHCVGSLHVYKNNFDKANAFLREGWQSTERPMPSMPMECPWKNVELFLDVERTIRQDGELHESALDNLNPYWRDLARILMVYSAAKKGSPNVVEQQRILMIDRSYDTFIERRLSYLRTDSQGV